ncbi:MAG: hypothetical protein HYW48_04825 [Deltaproteobacteria bacterium]|nr:hypothetical protein [Deltaproteobacteria bacterium]
MRLILLSKTQTKFLSLTLWVMPQLAFSTNYAKIPADWFIPERQEELRQPPTHEVSSPGFVLDTRDTSDHDTTSLERAIGTVLESNSAALDRVEEKGKWQLTNMRTSLAIGSSGTVGILMLEGESAVHLNWRRRPKEQVPESTNLGSNRTSTDVANTTMTAASENDTKNEAEGEPLETINMRAGMAEEDILRAIEPSVRSSLATGRIHNEKNFRENLSRTAKVFSELIQDIDDSVYDLNWYVSGFRLDLIVSASGAVLPWMKVGGDVRLRFIWDRIKRIGSAAHPVSQTPPKSGMKKFIYRIAEDLSLASEDALEGSGFRPDFMRVGVGFSVDGNIYVVKSGLEATFSLFFTRSKKPLKPRHERAIDHKDEYIELASGELENELAYARRHKINYEKVDDNGRGLYQPIHRVMYKIKRSHFRKGLEKSFRIARFFINQVNRHSQKHWEVSRVETICEMSLTGIFGLSPLTGIATTRLDFVKD